MSSKKYNLLLAVFLLLVGEAFAQKSTSGYDVYDSTVITRKRQPQQNEFWNNTYNFPAKPRNMWEVGISGGAFSISGDVPAVIPTFGLLHMYAKPSVMCFRLDCNTSTEPLKDLAGTLLTTLHVTLPLISNTVPLTW